MKTYFWMDVPSQGRMVIDDNRWPGAEVAEETQANSWLEAKRNFGLELTPMQEKLLGGSA